MTLRALHHGPRVFRLRPESVSPADAGSDPVMAPVTLASHPRVTQESRSTSALRRLRHESVTPADAGSDPVSNLARLS
jgi:hypothetical protein